MWASSRMGLRGFRVLLARTATKEDCIEAKLHRAIVMLNTAPPPPSPRPEGRVTPLCGLYWGLPLDMAYNFTPVFPSRVWSVRLTFHFVFLS